MLTYFRQDGGIKSPITTVSRSPKVCKAKWSANGMALSGQIALAPVRILLLGADNQTTAEQARIDGIGAGPDEEQSCVHAKRKCQLKRVPAGRVKSQCDLNNARCDATGGCKKA